MNWLRRAVWKLGASIDTSHLKRTQSGRLVVALAVGLDTPEVAPGAWIREEEVDVAVVRLGWLRREREGGSGSAGERGSGSGARLLSQRDKVIR